MSNERSLRRRLLTAVLGSGVVLGTIGTAYAFSGSWTGPWASEETPPTMCADDTVATRLECSGSNCDNIRVSCTNAPKDLLGYSWGPYRSEEQGTNNCPAGSYATGVDCRGNYCDDESIQCTVMQGATHANCEWVGPFSEEAPRNFGQCPSGKFIAGLFCSGSNCDNQYINCCNM